ncbi:hypothetical protein BgiBS90_005535 [Biomphalaria glabrata]|nr:hypothetical protein BgiBS90_005535 [Biomphalaria glabrata]
MLSLRLPHFHTKRRCEDARDNVVAVMTDDECAMERLRALNSLPVDKYTSVSVILDECRQIKMDKNDPVLKLGSFTKKLQLQPLCSNIPPLATKSVKSAQSLNTRMPPLSYEEETLRQCIVPRQQQPSRPHNGTVYPVEFASMPPYTSPGYSVPGVKQSIGVVRHPKVPAAPSMGVVGEERMKVPTWVSPLYKPYGVGGPYGPNGPFYRIPSQTCHKIIEPTFWRHPITYIRNAIHGRPKCKLHPKKVMPKMSALPNVKKLFMAKESFMKFKKGKKKKDKPVEEKKGITDELAATAPADDKGEAGGAEKKAEAGDNETKDSQNSAKEKTDHEHKEEPRVEPKVEPKTNLTQKNLSRRQINQNDSPTSKNSASVNQA